MPLVYTIKNPLRQLAERGSTPQLVLRLNRWIFDYLDGYKNFLRNESDIIFSSWDFKKNVAAV